MSYSQQQQPQYRPNQAALWLNDRKSAANQPDYKGSIEISYALLQELTAAFNAGQYAQDRGGQPCIKLGLGLYVQSGGQAASGKSRPVLSGRLSTVTETQQSAAARQQSAQQYQQAQAPQPAPQQYAPAPVAPAAPPAPPVYQQPQAPAPMAPPAPVPPMPGAIHGQPPAGPAPILPQGF